MGALYDTDRFMDIKLSGREYMLQKLMNYDSAKDAVIEFAKKYNCNLTLAEEYRTSISSIKAKP